MEYKDYISKFSQRVHTAKLSDISASKSYKEELITIKAMADKIHYDLNTEESKAKHIEDTIGNQGDSVSYKTCHLIVSSSRTVWIRHD